MTRTPGSTDSTLDSILALNKRIEHLEKGIRYALDYHANREWVLAELALREALRTRAGNRRGE